MKTKILDVPFDVVTNKQALEILMAYMSGNKNRALYTPNPEIVMEAQKDKAFMKILQQADLVIPDGIGVVWASRLVGTKLPERVTGCDLIFALFDEVKKQSATVYILGGKPGVGEIAKKNMEEKYLGLKIVGCHHGYFKDGEDGKIIEEIQMLKPDILLVCLGFPRQERWIHANKNLPVKISAAVGGSIDIMAGTAKRAPKIFQKLNLEWFYRLITNPRRAGRMLQLPVFMWKVLCRKWGEKK